MKVLDILNKQLKQQNQFYPYELCEYTFIDIYIYIYILFFFEGMKKSSVLLIVWHKLSQFNTKSVFREEFTSIHGFLSILTGILDTTLIFSSNVFTSVKSIKLASMKLNSLIKNQLIVIPNHTIVLLNLIN